ncbi:ATPase family AAA domain-containing protein 5 isoform X1 [Gopherus evgoodei]|uniref:ATPase family AAA domain-containing protein 5 isoform X1 n=1 Tax=Gopherus evgoodei TaxID=1825980 RepID=UPI0011CF101B|nr:ATPase family AAA domain-containing protein 5 isoform X1 [Gopherus evgoodei]
MMGRVTMAAPAPSAPGKDSDAPPCKKRREEDPPIKTITKYFSPLARTVDKVSPPKSNNILDYFKKTSTNEKTTLLIGVGENKINQSYQLCVDDGKDCKSPLRPSKSFSKLKRRGKRVNLNNKLRDIKTPENQCVIEINSNDSTDVRKPKEECLNTSFIDNSASALLAQKYVEELAADNQQSKNSSNRVTCRKGAKKTGAELNVSKNYIEKSRKREHKDDTDLSENSSSENELNEKELKDKKQITSSKIIESKSTVSISSLEVNVDKTSQLNDSTVTVSFEDFLKSQGENKVDQIPETKMPTLNNFIIASETDKSGSTSVPENGEESQQLPLRTVTVLAQIHPIPPKSPSLLKEQKVSRKIASIFLKQKGYEIERESSPSVLEIEQTEQMTQKRKSNVVIEEEELELAVLEAVSPEAVKPKCTVEERHQFMKAFRQPTSDTVKSGVKKIPGKLKEVSEKPSKQNEGMEESEPASSTRHESEILKDYIDKHSHCSTEKSSTTKERPNMLKKKRKKVLETKETNVPNSNGNNENTGANANIKEKTLDDIRILSHLKQNELRRSLRQKKIETFKNITPEKARISNTLSENALGDSPLHASTPKSSSRSLRKSNMYKAEVITVPFDAKSPIRMRFTRINASKKSDKAGAVENEEFTPRNKKMSCTSKNISKAKQLIEKAKAIQHNRSKANEHTPTPVRRSSRQQALAEKKKFQENEDSVIILDSSPSSATATTPSVEKKQKKLRSLNDVLGKKSRNMKVTKSSHGKVGVPPSFLGKKAQNIADEPILIFDESSQDTSENSQDDEQFKAKREFLMSGLPESLKRHIAKKAAVLEAYSVASCCFQKVVHVQQKDDRCVVWRLTSPSCPLLTKLRELNTEVTDVTKLTISLGEFSVINSKPSGNNSLIVLSGQRPVFPKILRKYLLEEIRSSNSQFPVRKVFYQFLKKQTEHVLFKNKKQVCMKEHKTTNSELDQIHSENQKETKRKRERPEDHKSKRRKQFDNAETELKSKTPKSTVTQVSCIKQADTEKVTNMEANKPQEPDVNTVEDSELGSKLNLISGGEKEDVLWTEKYQPQDSSELIGNSTEIKKLHSWLKEWKKRAYWEEKRNQKSEKDDTESQQDSTDSMDFKDDKSESEEENTLCNTVLITGPSGVGKTAAIYACAQELGFKIFEVNASCQRSGRHILSQLKEATQSHQVDKQGVNAHKPCFFNSCSSTKSPKKINSPRKAISPRKPPLSPKGTGLKRSLPPKTLANYFKISSKPESNEEIVKSQTKNKANTQNSSKEKVDIQTKSTNKEVGGEEPNKKNATSLILFEEVDIIFDEDAGFLSAIKTFMATAKRPVILTTNDPTFSLTFDGYFEEINFKTPSLINVASYLQVLCLAENLRMDLKDFATLLTTNNCDIRQSVLYLQFWVRSGGGCLKEKSLALHVRGEETEGTDQITSTENTGSENDRPQTEMELPKCDTGFIETLLGLKNIIFPSEDLFSFLKHKITTREEWSKLIQLLTEFQMKKVDFIYSNLEFILPLPVHVLPGPKQNSNPSFKRTTANSSCDIPLDSDYSEKATPVKKPKRMKHQRKLALLDDSDLFDTELNYSAEFITLPSDIPESCLEENKDGLKFTTNEKEKQFNTEIPGRGKSSALASHCLNSLSEFVENMSFLDCCLNANVMKPKEFCKNEGFNWTNGKIKNGLSDEFSIENIDWWSSQSCTELKAVIEALSFNKCSASISQSMEASLNPCKTLGRDQIEEITLHISKDRNDIFFGQSADLSIHRKAQKRLEIIKTVLSTRTPLSLVNRQASITEYLPTLRNICRSEKLKEQGKTKRRFLHYLEGIHLEIPKATVYSLAADFP